MERLRDSASSLDGCASADVAVVAAWMLSLSLSLVSIDQYGRSSCSSSLAKRQYEKTNQCLYLPFQKASGRP